MARDILIVDDEADIRLMLSGILEDEGYATREATDGESALAALNDRLPNLVILDIWLEGSKIDGLQVLEQIQGNGPSVAVVMSFRHGNIETAVSAIKTGPTTLSKSRLSRTVFSSSLSGDGSGKAVARKPGTSQWSPGCCRTER
jgi:DNA-binding NtrC family response regulator